VKDEKKSRDEMDRIDDGAVDWVIRREKGLTPSEQDEFLEWLAAAPLHGERYARQGRSWLEANLLAEWRPEHGDRPNPDLLARKTARPIWFRTVSSLTAAAAAIGLIFALISLGFREEASTDGREVTRVLSERYAYHSLEDGSEIDLNDGAELIIDYSEGQRLVELRSGEAHFTVAKDPSRPFVVRVGRAEIRALGTAFNVRRDSSSLEVLVTEGNVVCEVKDAEKESGDKPSVEPNSREVEAGQRSVMDLTRGGKSVPTVDMVEPEDIERLLSWKPAILEFKGTPLTEAIGEFNRRNRTQIVLQNEAMASHAIVASIRSNRIDEFVRLLELALQIESRKADDGTVFLFERS